MRRVVFFRWSILAFILVSLLFTVMSCTKEKVIIYKSFTEAVELISPLSGLEYETVQTFTWGALDDAISYQLQVSQDAIFSDLVFTHTLEDTTYTYTSDLSENSYYWRVRAKNNDDIWGDWSDALVWSFTINTDTDYLILKSTMATYGIAQDVFVAEDGPDSVIAYIADGAAGLTIVNVSDADNPVMVGNLDRQDGDYGYTTWKVPGDEICYMADLDGKIAALDTRLPLDNYSYRNISLGFDQNVTDIAGIVFQDTIYIFATRMNYTRRVVGFYQVVYNATIPDHGPYYSNPTYDLPADGKGICVDSVRMTIEYYEADRESTYYEEQDCMFVFAGATEAGIVWLDLSTSHSFHGTDTLIYRDPRYIGMADTPYSALKLRARDGFVYVADDRSGLQIFDLPDTIPAFDHDTLYEVSPVLISDINTSGRTKDVHLMGNYCYLADGSGGLKVIDISDPYNPVFLDAYDTPYAYGVYATEDYIYLCDRDIGLLIFEIGDLIN